MASLDSTERAKVALAAGESLIVTTTGQCTVQGLSGAPATTTTLTANSQTFGPYGVSAVLLVTNVSGRTEYSANNATFELNRTEKAAFDSLVSVAGKTRPGLLIVGNSIPGQSCRIGASLFGTGSTLRVATSGTNIKPGSNQLQLRTGDAATLAVNDYICVLLANQQPWAVQIKRINGDLLTLAERLPFAVRTGSGVEAGVVKVTPPVLWGGTWRQQFGIHNYANALIGAPFDVLPGYGHGGATAAEILAVLPQLLAFYGPAVSVAMLNLFENDVPGSLPATQMIAMGDQAAGICRAFNVTPIIIHCLPSFSIGGSRASAYDDLLTGVLSLAGRVPGAIGVDPGSIYRDTSIGATPRCALPGWTDGVVHPLESKRATIALDGGLAALLDTLAGGSRPDWKTLLYGANVSFAGTGGTAGAGTTGTVAANTTISCAGTGLSCVASKNADDSQRVTAADAGAVTAGSEILSVAQTLTLPATWGKKTRLKLVVEVTIHSQTNLGALRVSTAFGTQTIDLRTSASATEAFDPALVGRRIVLESMPFPMLDPSVTSATVTLDYRTLTGTGFAVDSTPHSLGFALTPWTEVDDGAIDSEDQIAQATRTTAYTVATLPAAAAGLAGFRAYVSDANATLTAGIGAVVAAGGANTVPVFCDGAAWRIG